MRTYDKKASAGKRWIIFLLIVNLLATAFILLCLFTPLGEEPGTDGILEFESARDGVYVMYIGTNDKDTYEQIIPTGDAVGIVNEICAKYAEGYTMSLAEGGWVDEEGVLTQENTLIYTFAYIEESAVVSIMDEVLTALNQNSILVERRDISGAFYHGKGK